MKRKFTTRLLAVLVLICAAVGLAACEETCAHTYSDWAESKAATCTESGEKTRTCDKCGNTETQTIDALGHEYAETGTTDESGHYHACTRDNCGEKSTDAEIDQNNDYACDVCNENLTVKLKTDVAALVGDGTKDNVDVLLNLHKNADSSIFTAIVDGLENAKDGSINLTISGAETVPEEAFKSCYALGSVMLGEGVKKIDKKAFDDARYMTSLIIGDAVTDIGKYAFSACYGLVDVTFGKKVENIGEGAFENTAIKSVVLPDSVKTLGLYTFGYCSSLTEIVLSKNIKTIPTNVFYSTAIKSLTVPDGVTTLENQAFGTCYKLESIVIPDSVTSIGEELFSSDTALKSITFGKGITKLSGNLFYGCSSLTEITFLSPITEVAGNTFYDEKAYVTELNLATANVTLHFAKDQKVLEQNGDGKWVATETELSNGNEFCGSTFKRIVIASTEIDTREMSTEQIEAAVKNAVENGATDLTIKFKANAGVEEFNAVCQAIQFSDWEECLNLTVTGVTEISTTVFYNYGWLKSITFGDGITALGGEYTVMSFCGSLECATIGKSVKAINGTVFYDCASLEKIVYEGTVEEWNEITKVENWVKDCPSVTEVVCSDGTVAL